MDQYLYKIESRNLSYGVFRGRTNGFLGIRYKFGSRFIFEEDHWDTGEPYGTVKPEKRLVLCPVSIENDSELFNWLDSLDYTKF
jgi:hypothetical protein